jgi:hypothetical protein
MVVVRLCDHFTATRAYCTSALARGWVVVLNGGGGIVAGPMAGEQLEDMVVTVGAVDGDKKSRACSRCEETAETVKSAAHCWRDFMPDGSGWHAGEILRWMARRKMRSRSPGNVRKEFARLYF